MNDRAMRKNLQIVRRSSGLRYALLKELMAHEAKQDRSGEVFYIRDKFLPFCEGDVCPVGRSAKAQKGCSIILKGTSKVKKEGIILQKPKTRNE